jgi:Tfp pilus assembly protein PilF
VIALLGTGVLIVLADDRGSAAVSAVGSALAILVALATPPDATRRRFGRRLADAGLRAHAIDQLRRDSADRLLKVPASPELAPVDISAVIRLRGRAATSGSTENLNEIFDSADGRLILLGEPGSGKSTALIRLSEILLQRAAASESAPLPLFVSLASWKEPRRRRDRGGDLFELWFLDRIMVALDVSRPEARRLRSQLVPLLDGLDEVAAEQRESCSRAIERFISHAPRAQAVISCRSTEYRELSALHLEPSTAYLLEPLTPDDLIGFFRDLDEAHWATLITALGRDDSQVAAALSTPLMLTVAIATWGAPGGGMDIPPPEVPAGLVRDRLWQRWIDRAAIRAQDDALELAVALARSAMSSGSSEVRLSDLGDSRTRRAWWATRVGLTMAFAVWVPAVFFVWGFLAMPFIEAADAAFLRFVAPRVRTASERRERWLNYGMFFVTASLGAGIPVVVPAGPLSAVAYAAVLGAVILWHNQVPEDLNLLVSWQAEPFKRIRIETRMVVGLGGVIAAALALVLDPRLALAAMLIVLSFFPLTEHAGHHWLARAWYRWSSRRGPLTARMADLVDAGFLRRTSDAYRFFHLELQRQLAEREGLADVYRVENVDAVWLLSRRASALVRAGDLEGAEEFFQRAVNAGGNDAVTLGWYANFLADSRGDRSAAEVTYKRAIKADPNNAAVLNDYAVFLSQQHHDPDGAEEIYRRALGADPNRALTLGNYAGFLSMQRHDADAAENMWRRAVRADPNNPRLLWLFARFLADTRDAADEAGSLFRRAVEANPRNAFYLSEYAAFLSSRVEDLDAAEEMYRSALAAEPGRPATISGYATFLADRRDDLDSAEALHRQGVEAAPSNAHLLANYALFLAYRRHDPDAAEAMFERACGSGPDDPAVLRRYAAFLAIVRSELEAADAAYRRAVEAAPEDASLLCDYAQFLIDHRDNVGAAEAAFRRALDADPSHSRSLIGFGKLLSNRRHDPDGARALFERALAIGPDSAGLRFHHALALSRLGDLPAAAAEYERAIAIDPEDSAVLGNYALVLASLGKDADTVESYHLRAINAGPDPTNLGNYANFLLIDRDDLTAARAVYERALAIKPDAPSVLAGYARLLVRENDLATTRTVFERAFEVSPEQPDLLYAYADALDQQGGDLDEIQALYERTIDADPTNQRYLGNYANFLAKRRGDPSKAATMYLRAIEAAPDQVQHLAGYVNLLIDQGDLDQAEIYFDRAVDLAPELLRHYAMFLVRRDKLEAADAVYRRAVERVPPDAEDLGMYALFLARDREDLAAARDMYDRAIEADPQNANNLGNYALLTLLQDDRGKAIGLIDQALAAAGGASQGPALAPLRLELRFYQWCAGREQDQTAAREAVLCMLDEGIRSPDWDLRPVLVVAERDDRADLDELRRAAAAIAAPPER